ncbi:hypothetical protein M422DRAFT_194386, partial [Sphaerobolus stellatus SS14]
PQVSVSLTVDCLHAAKTKELFANLDCYVTSVFFLPVRLNDQLFINLKTKKDWKVGKLEDASF